MVITDCSTLAAREPVPSFRCVGRGQLSPDGSLVAVVPRISRLIANGLVHGEHDRVRLVKYPGTLDNYFAVRINVREIAVHHQVTVAADADSGTVESMARFLRDHIGASGPIKTNPDGSPKIGALTNRSIKNSRPLFEAVRVNRRPPVGEAAVARDRTWAARPAAGFRDRGRHRGEAGRRPRAEPAGLG
jgi:hypothetical protein